MVPQVSAISSTSIYTNISNIYTNTHQYIHLNNGAAGVCHIIHQYRHFPPSIPNQHHACHLVVKRYFNQFSPIFNVTIFFPLSAILNLFWGKIYSRSHLIRLLPLLMDQCKVNVEPASAILNIAILNIAILNIASFNISILKSGQFGKILVYACPCLFCEAWTILQTATWWEFPFIK